MERLLLIAVLLFALLAVFFVFYSYKPSIKKVPAAIKQLHKDIPLYQAADSLTHSRLSDTTATAASVNKSK